MDMTTDIRVLGVDAALAKTGLALLCGELTNVDGWKVTDTDVIATSERHSRDARLAEIQHALLEVLDGWQPTYVWVEQPGHWARMKSASSYRTTDALAEARGAILVACNMRGVPVTEIGVGDVRATLAYPTATKEQVAAVLRGLSLWTGGAGDVSDAVAVAYAGARRLWLRAEEGRRQRLV